MDQAAGQSLIRPRGPEPRQNNRNAFSNIVAPGVNRQLMHRAVVIMYVRLPLSLRNVEELLQEHGIEIRHETVRFWWHRFGPMLAAEIRRWWVKGLRLNRWQWHLDEVFVKIKGEWHYLWRAVDHEGQVLKSFVTKRCGRRAALKFLRKTMKRHDQAIVLVTDKLRAYGAALRCLGIAARRETGR